MNYIVYRSFDFYVDPHSVLLCWRLIRIINTISRMSNLQTSSHRDTRHRPIQPTCLTADRNCIWNNLQRHHGVFSLALTPFIGENNDASRIRCRVDPTQFWRHPPLEETRFVGQDPGRIVDRRWDRQEHTKDVIEFIIRSIVSRIEYHSFFALDQTLNRIQIPFPYLP